MASTDFAIDAHIPWWPRAAGRWVLIFLTVVVLLGQSAQVQAQTYAYRNDVFAYDTPSGGAAPVLWHTTNASPACTQYTNGDDDWSDVAFPAGFSFTFGGIVYSSVRVNSNGVLSFPPDVSGFHRDWSPVALPAPAGPTYTGCATSAPVNIMLPYWTDIVAGTANNTTGASVRYETLGSTPNRRFVISWVNVKLYNTTTRYNFQVALYESAPGINSNFRYQYTSGSSDGGNATVGVQLSQSDYTQYSSNQTFIDTTNGTAILWYPANQLQTKAAEYRFDESSWSGAAGEIKDTSGNLLNASRVGSAANVANGKLCRGGTFTNNTSNNTVDAVLTPIVPGNQGSITFWYRSTNSWTTADTMLLDASAAANRPFFLSKRSTGALRFVVTDSAGTSVTVNSLNQSFGAATWVHVGVAWNVRVGTNQTDLRIFINGVLQNGAPTRGTTNGAMPSLATLGIGDNRTAGVTPSNGSPNGANGTIDEVYVYSDEISAPQAAADMSLTRPVCTTLDHFHIVHGGEQVSCNGIVANVTVEAHDAAHNLFSLAGTTMQMATSTGHGNWSGVATINPVIDLGGGNGTYTFANESSVVFGLSNPFIESLNININSGGLTEKTGSAATCVPQDYTFGTTCDTNLNFADSGFLFDVPNHVSEVSQAVAISAVKKADNSLVCTPAFANVSRSVTFTCAYSNPATGTLPVRVGGRALNTANSASAACDATGQAVSLAFNATGVASAAVQYADVGRMVLNASYASGGLTMTGTDPFVAGPASFAFGGVTAAPIKAGVTFSANVTARNNAGVAVPNFGKETPAEGVSIFHAKYQPTGTNSSAGNLTSSIGAFAGGTAALSLSWSEVGTIDLRAALASGNYLGSGLAVATGSTGSLGAVGRFIPHHFDTVVSEGACTDGFTYSGQPFTASVTARNLGGVVTQNYDGSGVNPTPVFAKNVTLIASGAAGTLANAAVAASLFFLGQATVVGGPAFSFAVTPSVPATIVVRATDADGVSSSGYAEGSTSIRSGRLRMPNVYGSELLALPIALEAQTWSVGGYYSTNTADICTVIPASSIVMGNYLNQLNPCETQLSPSGNMTLVGGRVAGAGLSLSAPGAGNAGSVSLSLNTSAVPGGNTCVSATQSTATAANLPWFGAGPTVRASFGIYKSPLIYRRENY